MHIILKFTPLCCWPNLIRNKSFFRTNHFYRIDTSRYFSSPINRLIRSGKNNKISKHIIHDHNKYLVAYFNFYFSFPLSWVKMILVWKPWNNVLKLDKIRIEGFCFLLHYKLTAAIFFLASVLTSTTQIIGKPIVCTKIPSIPQDVNNFLNYPIHP